MSGGVEWSEELLPLLSTQKKIDFEDLNRFKLQSSHFLSPQLRNWMVVLNIFSVDGSP